MANPRRARRATFIAGVSAVATALVIACGSVALLIGVGIGNSVSAEQSDQETQPVVAPVETGLVEELVAVQVQSMPTSTLEVPSPQLGTGVVTRAAPEGAVLNAGDILMAVDELPVIILEGSVPSYRSIGQGSQGKDVEQLQAYLRNTGGSVEVDGIFGASTAFALGKLYRDLGYPMISAKGSVTSDWRESGLPLSNHVFVASAPVVVGSACGRVGLAVASLKCILRSQESTPLLSDSSGRNLAGLPVKLVSASGDEVIATVGVPAAQLPAAPAPESPSSDADTGEDADGKFYSVTDLPTDMQTELQEQAFVVIEASAPEGLRVPATAVRETADGDTYLREVATELHRPTPTTDHLVEVLLCAGGYCAVRGDGVSAGMQVELLG